MHRLVLLVCAAASLAAAPPPATAASCQVRLSDLHLCCGGCSAALFQCLEALDEVSDIAINTTKKTAEFRVATAERVPAVLAAVAKAGFYGRATCDEAPLELPQETIDPETTADRIEFAGVHLCCKSCVKAVVAAFAGAGDVQSVDCDLKTRRVVIGGSQVNVLAARKLLNQAGLTGQWRR